jgi:FtsP/CotA-like multicopper oxidase with cupredoxin domain
MTSHSISRRWLLHGGAGLALAAGATRLLNGRALAQAPATMLTADTRILEVKGQAAKVYSLTQPDGTPGLETSLNAPFRVGLANNLTHDTLVHWHGLTPPSDQDGVPELSQDPLGPGGRYDYDFVLDRPGTYWMHSHAGLQEQKMLAAPLIVHDPADAGRDEQELVILLHDFSFKEPEEILQNLLSADGGGHAHAAGTPSAHEHAAKSGDAMTKMGDSKAKTGGAMVKAGATMNMNMDLNDVEFDAYLANDRTLDDPDIIRVELGGMVWLRIINAAASTNFQIGLGTLTGTLIAVDGQDVLPVTGNRFQIAIAQRLDIRVKLPAGQGSYPILAQREGDRLRTGVVLATKSGTVSKLAEQGESPAPPVGSELEKRLKAAVSIPARPVDRTLNLDLTGNMALYQWSLNGRVYRDREPLMVAEGERVEIIMRNQTDMAHPMHLHGHVFQVVSLGGKRFEGAVRDTVMVPPKGSVTIAFDADNPGRWAYHCHNLYHMAAGMFTSLEYLS